MSDTATTSQRTETKLIVDNPDMPMIRQLLHEYFGGAYELFSLSERSGRALLVADGLEVSDRRQWNNYRSMPKGPYELAAQAICRWLDEYGSTSATVTQMSTGVIRSRRFTRA